MFGPFLKFEGPGRQHKTTAIVDRAHEYPNFLDRLEEGKGRLGIRGVYEISSIANVETQSIIL
jgi:hypothetical protein